MLSVYILPTVEGMPPRAVLGDAEEWEGLFDENGPTTDALPGRLATWSYDTGAWMVGGVPLPQDVGDVITERVKDLGVDW